MELPRVLTLEEDDPTRPALEAMLHALAEPDLRALWARTRAGAAEARGAGDMARLFPLVRGTKTIQRIAGERGILIVAAPRR
jgi:hypothetical protein